MTKLFTTRMAQYILQKLEDKMNPDSPSKLKYAGLSGHESNLFPFMLQYKLTNLDCIINNLKNNTPPPVKGCETPPKFASNLMWELSQDNQSNWYVGTFFNGVLIKSCEKPNDDMYCTFEDFQKFMQQNFILSDDEFNE